MKKITYILAAYLVLGLTFGSCDKNDDPTPPTSGLDKPINDFVWKGMNSWYNWQTNVPDLANTKDDDFDAYNTYLNGFADPEDLFYSLLSQDETKINTDGTKSYKFSWIVDDYVALNNSFQGITKSFGIRLTSVNINTVGDIIFYVRYVAPGSPADLAGIKRGDIINALDGVIMTAANYSSVAAKLSNETVTLSFVSENNGVLTPISDKTITATVISEDPVYLKKVFTDINGKKVGYLVYNAFRSSYNDELNAAFAYFKNEGIQELILDLRLNGGGSVLTSAYLASMIDASAGTEIFAKLTYNAKHANESGSYTFFNTLNVYDESGKDTKVDETINRLSTINLLYVLTSGSTASASEMIINGLRPFMPVKVVGTTTYGKNVGSVTLYDSPDFKDKNINSNHTYAMQPIVFQIYNKLGQSDYINGFEPNLNLKVEEFRFWNEILPFGDENEVVLKAALDDIRGVYARQAKSSAKFSEIKEIEVSKLEKRFEKEMYITDEFFNQ